MDIGRVGIWTFASSCSRPRRRTRRRRRSRRSATARSGSRRRSAARRSTHSGPPARRHEAHPDRHRHRQHLGARRDGDGGGAEDARRGVPGPLPPRHRREPRAARRGHARPRLREAAHVPCARYLDAMDARAVHAAPPADRRRRACIGALAPKMLALAAERTDGAHPYFVPPEHTRARARDPRAGTAPRARAGRRARDATRRRRARVARAHMSIYLGLPNYVNNLRRLGFADDDIATAAAIAGRRDRRLGRRRRGRRARARTPRRRRRSRLHPGAGPRSARAADGAVADARARAPLIRSRQRHLLSLPTWPMTRCRASSNASAPRTIV